MGFGWSFYAFFICVIVWLAGYFAWARVADDRGPRKDPR